MTENIKRRVRRFTAQGVEILTLKEFRTELQRSRQNTEIGVKELGFTWGSPRERAQQKQPGIVDRIVEAIAPAPDKPQPTPRPPGAPRTTRPARRDGVMGLIDRILPRSKRQ
jgi:hypothetical protein